MGPVADASRVTVYVLTCHMGYPEDSGDEISGVYASLESAFREIARYCKGESVAALDDDCGPTRIWRFTLRDPGREPGYGCYRDGTQWWRAHELEVQP